jgi:cytochrome P450
VFLNDSISAFSLRIVKSLVFVEAQRQMIGLIDKIGGCAFAPASVMSKLSTHMIAGSGFGQYMDWSGTDLPSGGPKRTQTHNRMKPTTLASAVETFGEHLLPMIVFPAWLLKCLPSPTMNMVGNSKEKFESLVRMMIHKIRDAQKEKISGPDAVRTSDVLSNLVNAPLGVSGGAFSEKEIIGNVFALSFAAEETTSSALQTGLILLAINTDIQETLQAEIDAIYADKDADELMDYKVDWPKMRNLMAFMV